MKFSLLTGIVCMLAIPTLTVAESIGYTCIVGDYTLQKTDDGKDIIEMSDPQYHYIASPGDPALPANIIRIKVPNNITNVTPIFNSIQNTMLIGTYDIFPVPPNTSSLGGEDWGNNAYEKTIIDGKNINVYEKDALYPQQCIQYIDCITEEEKDSKGLIVSVNYLRFSYTPFQYNPIQKTLTLTSEITVAFNYQTVSSIQTLNLTSSPTPIADYVIITTNATVNSSNELLHFIAMKQKQGYSVRVVTETDFDGLTGQSPNGRAERIREWLKINYIPLGIKYVLLIGDPNPDDPFDNPDSPYNPNDDVGDIPMKMCYPRYYETDFREYPTDFFYADLVGNWDVNGDDIYGVNFSSINPNNSPHSSIAPTTFSGRWTGKVEVSVAQNYVFNILANDGIRLFINNNLVIDNWIDCPAKTYSTTPINLSVGLHDIKIEYYHNNGHGVIKGQMNESYLNYNILYYFDSKSSTYKKGGINVTYYNDTNFTGTSYSTIDKYVINTWGTGDDHNTGRKSISQVNVGRIPVYNNDYAALDKILRKNIGYQSDDPSNINWRKSILIPIKDTYPPHSKCYRIGEEIRNKFAIADGFSCFRIYEQNYSVTPPPEIGAPFNVSDVELNWINNPNSRGMITWAAHGSPHYADHIFHSNRASYLNDNKPSITFQGSCLNGYPEIDFNLGYSLLKNGAITTVSASRVSFGNKFTDVPDAPTSNSTMSLSYAYTKEIINKNKSAGEALSLIKQRVQNSYVSSNIMAFNLYGDPSCYLLTTYPNLPPTANTTGPYTTNQGSSINIDASVSSDPEGDALQYRFDYDGNGTYDTPWSTTSTYSFCTYGARTYNAIIEVKDLLGFTSTTTTQITFLNVAPVVNAGPDITMDEGQLAIFTGSFTDPGWEPHTYIWDLGDGTTNSSTLNPTHMYVSPGTYNVKLTVTDAYGGIGEDFLTVTVNNIAPTVDAGKDVLTEEGIHVLFDGKFTDPGSGPHTITWDLGDGTIKTGILFFDHAYSNNGTYNVKLTVADPNGGIGEDFLTVTVNNADPIITKVDMTPIPAIVGQPLLLKGHFVDPGWLDTHTSAWDFGDGTSATGIVTETNSPPYAIGESNVTKTYTKPGTYNILLRIYDNDGATIYTIRKIDVKFDFTITPNPVPVNTPVTVKYTIPPEYANANVRIIEHREWDILYRSNLNQSLSGSVGTHTHTGIWFWNKYYFGNSSGPYLIELEVNGQIVGSVQLEFAY